MKRLKFVPTKEPTEITKRKIKEMFLKTNNKEIDIEDMLLQKLKVKYIFGFIPWYYTVEVPLKDFMKE